MQKSQITIVGGGIPGLALALILADSGLMVTVVDRRRLMTANEVEPSSRTTALMHGSLDVLDRAGVWAAYRDQCARLKKLSIIDDSLYPRGANAMIQEDFRAEELGLDEFGYNVPLMPIMAILADRVKAHAGITVMEGVEIDPTHDVIVNADLIVGADGRKSIVRDWAGIGVSEKDYGQSAITCVISHSLSHNDTSTEFHRNGGPCTFVPFTEKQSAVVWVEKTSDADGFLKLPKVAFVNALQERTRGILGQIDLVVEPSMWPLISLRADKLTAPKTALIAEAAHVLSPIGAQGLNLSLRDVGALADLVVRAHQAGRDVGDASVLKAYEHHRQRDMMARHIGVDFLNQMVANDNLLVRGLRRIGLRAMRHLTPIRHILMQEGLSPRT